MSESSSVRPLPIETSSINSQALLTNAEVTNNTVLINYINNDLIEAKKRIEILENKNVPENVYFKTATKLRNSWKITSSFHFG
ncbi:MAG: hypothetical protein ACYDEF_09345 [Methanosarcina sp.]